MGDYSNSIMLHKLCLEKKGRQIVPLRKNNQQKNHSRVIFLIIFHTLFYPPLAASLSLEKQGPNIPSKNVLSLKNEVHHAIDRGLRWLKSEQCPGGYWSQPNHPALSSLVLTAFMGEPTGRFKTNPPPFIKKGYGYLLSSIAPDGGIYVEGLANYNTAVSMTALVASENPAYESTLQAARAFLIGLQGDFDEKGRTDSPYDGGIGYGARFNHSDISNTMFALEAIHYTRHLDRDKKKADLEIKKLNWPAVTQFIQRCQNLPSHNDQPWASEDSRNKGGFIYFPGRSKAGEMKLPSGKTALRSYGSISYAGLLSYIYANLDDNDPRVLAVYNWLEKNYTLEENPGMGRQGLYYYYHTMAKALSAYKIKDICTHKKERIYWRQGLALKLLDLQQGDGYWMNQNGRWWEKDPVLVTSYAVITLEIIYRELGP